MARRIIIGEILNLIKGLGGNPSKFMGTKSNISFLGKGPKESLFQGAIDAEGMVGSGFPVEALIREAETAGGYATANKLNDLQLQRLKDNLIQLKKAYFPPQVANITDMATGTGDLTQEGIASLREGVKRFPRETHQFFGRPLKDADFVKIDRMVMEGKIPDAKGRTWNFKTPKPGARDIPQKTYAARATMYKLLDMEAAEGGVTLREIMSKQDLKWLLEGGGGVKGDPIAMFAKYFGNATTKQLPSQTTPEVIEEFATQVMQRKDRLGRGINDPFFRREDIDFAGGGLAHILQVPTRSGMRIGGLGLLTRGLRAALKRTKGAWDNPGADFQVLMDNPSYLMSPVNMQKIKKLELYRRQLVRDVLRKEGGGKFTHGPKPEATRADLELLDDYIAKLKNKIKEVGYYGEGAAPEKALVQERNVLLNKLPFSKFVRDKYTASELKQLIIQKYKGRIDDKLLQQMLVDDNPQRLAEVMATIDEALLMQGKGMGPETIMTTLRDSWKRKPSASGGLAKILEV